MPFYLYTCSAGHKTEEFRPIAKCRRKRRCATCRRIAHRDFAAERTALVPDLKPFWSEAMGKGEYDAPAPGQVYDRLGRMYIGSRQHLREQQRLHYPRLGPRNSYVE